MDIHTSDIKTITPFIKRLRTPEKDSHKGQNGRALIIGGSSLFHASAIWAAEVASHFVDIVHFASTEENNQIFFEIKKKFQNGILVSRHAIADYVKEDDAILVGPGMIREENISRYKTGATSFTDLLTIKNEAEFTYKLTRYLIEHFPDKRFVFDAGALQMMDPAWLKQLNTPALITPHQLEFERLFNIEIKSKQLKDKIEIVKNTAKEYRTVILLKAVDDIISDGNHTYVVHGGNQGLTKGGTGDILAGLCTALYAKNEAVDSAVIASYLLKQSADRLSTTFGYWYNNDNLINAIPETIATLYNAGTPHGIS